MKKNTSIYFTKDDPNLNDYLFCWSEFDERPNRVTIYESFQNDYIENIFSDYNISESFIDSEIYPTYQSPLENRKQLLKIDDGFYISYTIFDANSDQTFIGDLVLYFKKCKQYDVDILISKLENNFLKEDSENSISNNSLFTISFEQNGYEFKPIDYLKADYENIQLFYNDSVIKKIKKLSKSINENTKGISIIWGERGTGKTTLCCHLLEKIEKTKVFIPLSLVENCINGPDFRNFLSKNRNLVIVVDDCENFISDLFNKNSFFSKNLIQLVDGLDSDNYNVNFLLIFNIETLEDIQEDFLNINNLIEVLEVDYLNLEKSKDLAKHLKKNRNIKKEQKLIDIIKKKNKPDKKREIGF